MKSRFSRLALPLLMLGLTSGGFAAVQPPPAAWAIETGAISTTRDAGGDGFRFVHSGKKNWSVTLAKAQPAAFGDRYALTCETEAVGVAGATNAFQVGVVLSEIGGKVVNWVFAETRVKPGETAHLAFIVPRRGAAIAARLRGWGPSAARVKAFRLERVGRGMFNGEELATFDGDLGRALPGREGCFIRDVAADGEYTAIGGAGGEAAGCRLAVENRAAAGGRGGACVPVTRLGVTLEDLTGRDRAVSLAVAEALPEGEITWFGNARTGVVVRAGEFSDSIAQGDAGRGRMAHGPFAAVAVRGRGYAIGFDPGAPAFGRLAVNADARQLYAVFDLGLAPEKKTARMGLVTFSFDAAHGFRGALAAYRALFPEAFKVRCARQGSWTVTDRLIGKLPHPEDFGFRFRGRMAETAWDDARDILTFRYTEPCTWWVKVPKALTGDFTLADGLAEVERLIGAGDKRAKVWRTSVMEDEKGRPVGRCLRRSWCQGVVWSLNSAPGVNGGRDNDFTAKLVPEAFDARYPKPFPQGLDGEYMDSIELYVTPWCDYARAHFAGMTTPLTFAKDSKRPVVFKGLVAYEYAREVARLAHGKGRLTLANCTPIQWWWLTPFVDVLGSEVWWLKEDRKTGAVTWRPMTDAEFIYRRALAGGKPIPFLMDAPFDKFTRGMTERYFARSLAYGCLPGFFTWHGVKTYANNLYFLRPDCYERDRPLFKKYLPLCRAVAEAGWQPVNELVESDNARVITEQFGAAASGTAYATVFNLSDRPERVRMTVRTPGRYVECVEGSPVAVVEGTVSLTLPPEGVRVLKGSFGGLCPQ